MADSADDAEKLTEFFKHSALRAKKEEGPPPVGFCYNCDSPVDPGARWCDADCRTDWLKRSKRQAHDDNDQA